MKKVWRKTLDEKKLGGKNVRWEKYLNSKNSKPKTGGTKTQIKNSWFQKLEITKTRLSKNSRRDFSCF